jgi:hypothetical protein
MLTLLATLAGLYIVLMALLLLFERRFIFFPQFPGRLTGDWQPQGLPVEDVWLTAEDGVKLHAWWIPAPQAEVTLLAFHGNAANLPNRAEIYDLLRSAPANVLAVEYRGYGRSEGSPSEAGIYRDARAGYEYLTRQRGIAPGRIVAYGASLGSTVAAHLAAEREVGGVILEAPFPSTAAVARRVYWFLPGLGLLARTKLDTAAALARVHAPLLVLHCTRDPVISFSFGEELFRRAHEPKRFVSIEAACHEDASLAAPDEYLRALREFIGSLRLA